MPAWRVDVQGRLVRWSQRWPRAMVRTPEGTRLSGRCELVLAGPHAHGPAMRTGVRSSRGGRCRLQSMQSMSAHPTHAYACMNHRSKAGRALVSLLCGVLRLIVRVQCPDVNEVDANRSSPRRGDGETSILRNSRTPPAQKTKPTAALVGKRKPNDELLPCLPETASSAPGAHHGAQFSSPHARDRQHGIYDGFDSGIAITYEPCGDACNAVAWREGRPEGQGARQDQG
jgi:hypothetical protein